MTRFNNLTDVIKEMVQKTVGDHSQNLYYSIRWIDDKRVILEFARWDEVKKAYVPVGKVNDDTQGITHIEESWPRSTPLPKLMQEAEDVASRAYQSHMEWIRQAKEKGLL